MDTDKEEFAPEASFTRKVVLPDCFIRVYPCPSVVNDFILSLNCRI
jgi:hypothetical protein